MKWLQILAPTHRWKSILLKSSTGFSISVCQFTLTRWFHPGCGKPKPSVCFHGGSRLMVFFLHPQDKSGKGPTDRIINSPSFINSIPRCLKFLICSQILTNCAMQFCISPCPPQKKRWFPSHVWSSRFHPLFQWNNSIQYPMNIPWISHSKSNRQTDILLLDVLKVSEPSSHGTSHLCC